MKKIITKAYQAILKHLTGKHPLTDMVLPSTHEQEWVSRATSVLEANDITSVGEMLENISLGITSKVTGLKSDIDLRTTAFPIVRDVIFQIASKADETIYIYVKDTGWEECTAERFNKSVNSPLRNGLVELYIIHNILETSARYSINFWRETAGTIQCKWRAAPIKKINIAARIEYSLNANKQPIDIVYTWVNNNDKDWIKLASAHMDIDELDPDRFAQSDELKYSLRSVFSYAPWINKVYILSNCAPPDWFVESERVMWVKHEDAIEAEYLPLFSSHAIETFINEIDGLSENYIYFNDDVFLSTHVRPNDFFTPYGQSISRLESYGVISNLMQLVESGTAAEWQNAAINGANLIHKHTGHYPSQLHQHAPFAVIKSVFKRLTEEFPKQLETTRRARFRQDTDYSFVSFLYHHFALSKGKAVTLDEEGMIVNPRNMKNFLEKKMYLRKRYFCINDGGGSSRNEKFNSFKNSFLPRRYPIKSPAER